MRYPEKLKVGDTIGICAPSDGEINPFKQEKLDYAIRNLEKMGYKVIETESVRKSQKGRSSSAEKRAKEFMELVKNPEVKLIQFVTGGDFLVEMLDYLDLEELKKIPPKWLQGYSDITGLEFVWNTILDMPSIYCENVKSYAMEPLYRNLTDAFKIMGGKEISQESYEKYESRNWKEENLTAGYALTEENKWKNIRGEKKIVMEGRAIGGCMDCITNFFGTKYDKIRSYIEKYKKDGIIWFLECFEMGTAELCRRLWQMKVAGYFENCKGIIFGRTMFPREDFEIGYEETILDALKATNIPIITQADIGHVSPQMAIVNGGFLRITCENGKGKVENFWH